ncbi:putative endonuclease 4 [Lentilactobacillus parabuchneri]|nr:putative endonuclease 4 [Lentilactobacillus parabuchneri]
MHEALERAESFFFLEIVLHPGAHVGAGPQKAIDQIAKGLNEVISDDQTVQIALETMAGKGTEVGTSFEQLAEIIDKVTNNDLLSVTFDTCHTSDAGYAIKDDFDGVLNEFDHVIGIDRLKVIHLNDSKNEQGSHKETPILKDPEDKKAKWNPHGYEVAMLKRQVFNPNIVEDMKAGKPF